MNETNRIKLIEAPLDDNQEIFRQELEEALGGWNCGSFDHETCYTYDDNTCSNTGAGSYCVTHSCSKKKVVTAKRLVLYLKTNRRIFCGFIINQKRDSNLVERIIVDICCKSMV